MENYKDDVAQSRVGCLGSSDGKLLAQVCALGYVPKSAYHRLAVCKGLIEQEDIPMTAAVKAGDAMEMLIYKHLSANDPRYESNPRWVSKKYSMPNVTLIAHPDMVLKDDARKTLYIYETKTTKYTVEETRQSYKAQLFIEYIIGKELCEEYGKDWNVKLSLVHYNTDGLDLAQLLADRLAEAAAERMHEQVRKDIWGYAKDEQLTIPEMLVEKFQGIRPAVGYPSLPDTSLNFVLDELIDMKQIGIRLTESGAMKPHASVSGLMMAHPQARYFNLGKIGADQLQDYARRRGLPVEVCRKFLASNL